MNEEVLTVITHMARQLVWLDVVQVCACIAAAMNIAVLVVLLVRLVMQEGRK